jgi:hypothetical protein
LLPRSVAARTPCFLLTARATCAFFSYSARDLERWLRRCGIMVKAVGGTVVGAVVKTVHGMSLQEILFLFLDAELYAC